jgi:hypothetical protein
MTYDDCLVKRIRSVLGEHVSNQSDSNLLAAYACWCVYGKQNWSSLLRLLDPKARKLAWDYAYIS